jgi:hypothetical protein
MEHQDTAGFAPGMRPGESELLAAIRQLETRVRELDAGRDSAYEKALVRSYEQALDGYRARLATLRTA